MNFFKTLPIAVTAVFLSSATMAQEVEPEITSPNDLIEEFFENNDPDVVGELLNQIAPDLFPEGLDLQEIIQILQDITIKDADMLRDVLENIIRQNPPLCTPELMHAEVPCAFQA